MNENRLNDSDIRGKIDIAFARLIGPLAIMTELKSYESSQEEIHNLLNIVTKWGAKFQSVQNLSFINSYEILNVYNRLDALKDKFLFDTNLGFENELSDEIVIWMYELMELRKTQIESLEMANNKLITNLDKTYMDMLKGIIDEEQYVRVSESIKKIENNKTNIDNH